MRNAFSALIVATSFALLVPDNRAQAVGAAELTGFTPVVATQTLTAAPAVAESTYSTSGPQVPPEMSWLLALGFLGVVIARRIRPG